MANLIGSKPANQKQLKIFLYLARDKTQDLSVKSSALPSEPSHLGKIFFGQNFMFYIFCSNFATQCFITTLISTETGGQCYQIYTNNLQTILPCNISKRLYLWWSNAMEFQRCNRPFRRDYK